MGTGNKIHFIGSLCFTFRAGTQPESFVWGVTMKHAPAAPPPYADPSLKALWSHQWRVCRCKVLHINSALGLTVLRAYCRSLKTIEKRTLWYVCRVINQGRAGSSGRCRCGGVQPDQQKSHRPLNVLGVEITP